MSLKSFSQFLEGKGKRVVFAFGRFNPPTVGHEKLLDKVKKEAGSDDYYIYASQSNDAKKNPLDYTTKVKFMRKMFPRHARNIILDKSVRTAFDILTKFYSKGYTQVEMVVGSDRVTEFDALLNKYNGVEGRHGFYNFEGGLKIVSAGDRDPDSDDVSGMSASKMRAAVQANDLSSFTKGLPAGFKEVQALFNEVRKGLGLKESKSFREHVQLEVVSDTREAYVSGDLYKKGDQVIISESNELAVILVTGANYLIIENQEGKKVRKWLDDVEPLEGRGNV